MKFAASPIENQNQTTVTHKYYLALAIPLIISGISTPILGAVDTAVVGRMPDASYIGGVAVGALIFNTMYWLLGFLRVSTTGFTSQAQGSNNDKEMILSFLRPAIIAALLGFLFIIFQYPILQVAMYFIGASETVTAHASTYFYIRIWGAPFTLLSYVMIGWLMGMGSVRLSLLTQVFMNVLNILLDLIFVLGFGFGVAGVAYATLIAEVSAVLLGAGIIFRAKQISFSMIRVKTLLQYEIIMKMLRVNRDLFLRTVCLLTMTVLFTAKGASMGEVTLAANAVLFQLQYIIAYLFGGLANASSILVGRAIGSNNVLLYRQAFNFSAVWGFIAAVVLSLMVFLYGDYMIAVFTNITQVLDMADQYLFWMIIFPFVGFWAMQLEGIFFGATEPRFIRDSITLSLIVFLISIWVFIPLYGNHGLWLSFILFTLARALFSWMFVPKLTNTLNFNKV